MDLHVLQATTFGCEHGHPHGRSSAMAYPQALHRPRMTEFPDCNYNHLIATRASNLQCCDELYGAVNHYGTQLEAISGGRNPFPLSARVRISPPLFALDAPRLFDDQGQSELQHYYEGGVVTLANHMLGLC
jgi:hypothetical protein